MDVSSIDISRVKQENIDIGVAELISAVKEHAVIWDRSCDDYNPTSWPDWIAICKDVSANLWGDEISEEDLNHLGE